MVKLHFPANGYQLAGALLPAATQHSLAFLFIQGWVGHQNMQAAQKLTELGFTCMTYDMRGNGESEGNLAEFSRADFVSDAVVAYDYLQKRLGNDTRIGVVGSSFGSYTTVMVSSLRKVYCMSLRVPANYPDEGFTEPQLPQIESSPLHAWRKQKLSYGQNKTLQILHDFEGKVQIIEASADERIDRQTVENYRDAIADTSKVDYSIMEGAPHSLVNDELQTEYEELLVGWVKSLD